MHVQGQGAALAAQGHQAQQVDGLVADDVGGGLACSHLCKVGCGAGHQDRGCEGAQEPGGNTHGVQERNGHHHNNQARQSAAQMLQRRKHSGDDLVDINVQIAADDGAQQYAKEHGQDLIDPLADKIRYGNAVLQDVELGVKVVDHRHQNAHHQSHEHTGGTEAAELHAEDTVITDGGLDGNQEYDDGSEARIQHIAGMAQLFHQLIGHQEGEDQRCKLEGELQHAAQIRQGRDPGAEHVVEEDQRASHDDGQNLHHRAGKGGHPGILGDFAHCRSKLVLQPVHDLTHCASSSIFWINFSIPTASSVP